MSDNVRNAPADAASPEQRAISAFAHAALEEQRRARRWGIFFKSLGLLYLFALLAVYAGGRWQQLGAAARPHTALVDVEGIIAPDAEASADNIVSGLRAAFDNEHVRAVVLRLNSPGGSPVQAGYVNDEIRRLREAHPDTPVYAVVQDVCASGCYYVAVAADRIYADKASIVGSIGVRMDSFGFVEAMRRLGIERRLFTAGEHKGLLDPFLPLKPDEVAHVKGLLEAIHRQFIDTVRAGRGARLADDPAIFSGLFWTGEQALGLGLVDALGSAGYVAREVVGEERVVDYTVHEDYLTRLGRRWGAAALRLLARPFDWR